MKRVSLPVADTSNPKRAELVRKFSALKKDARRSPQVCLAIAAALTGGQRLSRAERRHLPGVPKAVRTAVRQGLKLDAAGYRLQAPEVAS